jgi:GGDEF domain-containing protein
LNRRDGLGRLALTPTEDLLGAELAKGYANQPCAAIVCQFASLKEIGDEYGMPGVDSALAAITEAIAVSLPPGALVAKLKLTIFCILLHGDNSTAARLARQIVRRVTEEPVEVPKGRVALLKAFAGTAASNEGTGLPPAQLIFEAAWRALTVAPYREGGVASG